MPSFSPEDWMASVNESLPDGKKIHVPAVVVGPFDAVRANIVRKNMLAVVDLYEARPVDIFILNWGTPEDRRCTKIGGLPYLRNDRDWPTASDGEYLPFLVQFDFRESQDLIKDLPGEMLLVFGDLDAERGIQFIWESEIATDDLIQEDEVPAEAILACEFWGTRWRTVNYPHATPVDDDYEVYDSYNSKDGYEINSAGFAINLMGLQIGNACGTPFPGLLEGDEEVICMVTRCGATLESPYPLLNHPDPIWRDDFDTDISELTQEEKAEYDCFFPLSAIKDCDGFGLLYILRSEDGSFTWHLGNL